MSDYYACYTVCTLTHRRQPRGSDKRNRSTGSVSVLEEKDNEMANNKRPWSPPQMIWSALIAVVVWSAIGFNWFGYGFDWSTQVGASRMSTNAVVENLATICVAQAKKAPDAEAALKQLAALQNWKRREFIEDAQWAIMPGSDSAQSGVADLCATKLLEI